MTKTISILLLAAGILFPALSQAGVVSKLAVSTAAKAAAKKAVASHKAKKIRKTDKQQK